MPIVHSQSPKNSRNRLGGALQIFGKIKAKDQRWLKFSASLIKEKDALHPHPVYTVRLRPFLEGKPLSATLRKVAWMYFLRDRGKKLACAEVSIVSGQHRNARFSEGPFVKKLFHAIEKLNTDPRIRRRRYQLRSVRLESMHSFWLWLKLSGQEEYFIAVTSGGTTLRKGDWLSRREFTQALRSEAERIRAAHKRMSELIEAHQHSS